MDAIRKGVHRGCLLSYITLFYTLGEKLNSYVADFKKRKTGFGMAQPSLLYLTECPPQHLPFRPLVGNKDNLRVGRMEEENSRGALGVVCSCSEEGSSFRY